MGMVMFQFRHRGGSPTLEQVRATYGLQPDQVDADYGVVATDSQEGLHVILVDESAQAQIDAKLKQMGVASDRAVGVFANPRIEPFDTPRADAKK